MTDLRDLRSYFDALADDALFAALDRPVSPRARRRSLGWAATAAAAIVIGLVAVALVVLDADSSQTRRVRVGQSPTTEPTAQNLAAAYPECVRTETVLGCARTPAEASRMLGIPIDVPTDLPAGWTVTWKVVRIFAAGSLGGLPDRDVGDYSQVWSPGGEAPNDDPNPTYIQITEREALPFDEMCGLRPLPPLADGTTVCGHASEEPIGSDGHLGGSLVFTRNSVRYRVTSSGLTQSQLYQVLNSFR